MMKEGKISSYDSEISFAPQKLTDERFHKLIENYHELSIKLNSMTGFTYTNLRLWFSVVIDMYELYGRLIIKDLERDLFDKQFAVVERLVDETLNNANKNENKVNIDPKLIRLIRKFVRDLFFAIQGGNYFFYGRQRIKQQEFIKEIESRTEIMNSERFSLDDIDKLFMEEDD